MPFGFSNPDRRERAKSSSVGRLGSPGVEHFEIFLAALFVSVAGLNAIARWLSVPYPIPLVLGGLALGLLPGIPEIELDPDLVLVIFLPPLLYAAAFFSDLRALRARPARDLNGVDRPGAADDRDGRGGRARGDRALVAARVRARGDRLADRSGGRHRDHAAARRPAPARELHRGREPRQRRDRARRLPGGRGRRGRRDLLGARRGARVPGGGRRRDSDRARGRASWWGRSGGGSTTRRPRSRSPCSPRTRPSSPRTSWASPRCWRP